ncbi:uncharacterized protein LOC107369097 isoform X2 [Tetranychus urticae]|uniref:Uncharacterized protein n=1 Tax=Tetranychus urticae TaxID=32264 RepID=T1L0M3_TETUR|nr:uncharacterized protein LOC107369097 isoform X2 [Tetranychus urticae]
MSEDNDTPDRITIKVKVAGEDYYPIVIDWSDKTHEYQQQQLFRQLEIFTGIPNESVTFVRIFNPINNSYFTNMENPDHYENTWPFTKESVSQIISDGDEFCLSTFIEPFRIERVFRLGYQLLTGNMTHPTECTEYYCQHSENRNFLNQIRRIVINSELALQVRPLLDQIIGHNLEASFRVMELFNIRQFFDPCCRIIGRTPGHRHKRRYLPESG